MKRKNRKNRRNTKPVKFNTAALRRLVLEEAAKLDGKLEDVSKVKAKEVEASEFADTIEQDIDMYKAMKIKEARLQRQHRRLVQEARRIRRNKRIAKKRILRNLK